MEFLRLITEQMEGEFATCTTDEQRKNTMLFEKLKNEIDKGGISVFKLSSNVTATRIVAAITAKSRTRSSNVSFSIIKDFIVIPKHDPADDDNGTKDGDVNHSHFEFRDLGIDGILELAKAIVEGYNDQTINLLEAWNESVNASYLQRHDVKYFRIEDGLE